MTVNSKEERILFGFRPRIRPLVSTWLQFTLCGMCYLMYNKHAVKNGWERCTVNNPVWTVVPGKNLAEEVFFFNFLTPYEIIRLTALFCVLLKSIYECILYPIGFSQRGQRLEDWPWTESWVAKLGRSGGMHVIWKKLQRACRAGMRGKGKSTSSRQAGSVL